MRHESRNGSMALRNVASAAAILTALCLFALLPAPALAETHPQRVEKAISQAISGDSDQLERTFKSDLPKNERKQLTSKKDALLAMLELGALHQMVGRRLSISIRLFGKPESDNEQNVNPDHFTRNEKMGQFYFE